MATNGKLEAQITIPTGGWGVDILETGGGENVVVTIPAGLYFQSSDGGAGDSIFQTFEDLLNASALLATYVVTLAAGESGTGKYTLTASGGGITEVEWNWVGGDTELRDLLGFAANLTGSLAYTGTLQAQALWLPDYPFDSLNGGPLWSGWWETDQKNRENANGNAFSIIGRKKQINSVNWNFASRAKCWAINEVTVNESFEQFLLDGVWAGAAWGTSAGPVRFYGDADDDATFATYAAFGLENWRPDQVRPGWVHGWVIVLPRLIKVPE